MASKRCRSDNLLPWILAIEALASNQTDTSLLIGACICMYVIFSSFCLFLYCFLDFIAFVMCVYWVYVIIIIIGVDLVKKIPGDLPENDGKNAREWVCLRILESLSVLEKGKFSDGLPELGTSVRISPSDCCEDVLRQVLRKVCLRVCMCLFLDVSNCIVRYLCYCVFYLSFGPYQKSNETGMSRMDIEPFVQHRRSISRIYIILYIIIYYFL